MKEIKKKNNILRRQNTIENEMMKSQERKNPEIKIQIRFKENLEKKNKVSE